MNNIKKPRLKKNLDKGYLNEIKGSDIICDLSFIDEKSLNDIKDIEFNYLKISILVIAGLKT